MIISALNGVYSDRYILQILTIKITKAGKNFRKWLDFKAIKFRVKTRDIHKIEKSNSIGISVFGYENKEKYPI